MGSGIKILRLYSDKIKRSNASLQGIRAKQSDERRVANYFACATLGLTLPISFMCGFLKDEPLVNLLLAAPAATAISALKARKSVGKYERQATLEHDLLDSYKFTYESERLAILNSVRAGRDVCLTELSECFEAGIFSKVERNLVLDQHRLRKSNLSYILEIENEEERLKHERQSQEDDPHDGYDGWLDNDGKYP